MQIKSPKKRPCSHVLYMALHLKTKSMERYFFLDIEQKSFVSVPLPYVIIFPSLTLNFVMVLRDFQGIFLFEILFHYQLSVNTYKCCLEYFLFRGHFLSESFKVEQIKPQGYKTFLILSSAEQEIYPAHEY